MLGPLLLQLRKDRLATIYVVKGHFRKYSLDALNENRSTEVRDFRESRARVEYVPLARQKLNDGWAKKKSTLPEHLP